MSQTMRQIVPSCGTLSWTADLNRFNPEQRLAKTDGIASLKEQGIDVELGNWRGIFGAPGITPAQRDALVAMVKAATETPAWKATLEKLGWANYYLGGEDYRKFIEEDTKRIGAVIDSLGIK